MSLELTIGANVQPAITAINDMKLSLQKLKDQLSKTTDPTETNRLTSAIVNQKNQLQQALAASNGFATGTFGVSRAARVAHSDIDQTVRSIEAFSSGSQGAAAGVSNLIFTFERLKGVTGSTSGALGSIAEAFLSPAGLVLAIGAAIPLIIEVADKFSKMSDGSRQAKEELDALTESLKRNKLLLEGYNDDLDQAAVIRKLKIDIETPQGTGRTIADLNADLDAAHTKLANVTPALKEWQSEVDKLVSANDKLTEHLKDQHAELSSEGKVLFEGNQKKIDALQKQIDEFKKQESQAKATIAEIPFKIKLVQTDQAAEDVRKAAEKAAQEAKKSAAEREREAKEEAARLKGLFTVFAAPDKLDVPSLKNTQSFFDALKADINKKSKEVEINISPKVQLHLDERGEAIKKAEKDLAELNAIINNGLGDIAASFAQGIGSIVGGGDISSAFAGVFKSIGGALQALGKAMIAHAIALQAFKKAFTNPLAEAAAGFGLIVAGAALQTALSKSQKFATGGLVFGPTLGLVGEGSGTSRSNPEVIAPLDKLKGMLGGLALGGNSLQFTSVLKGSDIVLAVNRTNRTQGRGG